MALSTDAARTPAALPGVAGLASGRVGGVPVAVVAAIAAAWAVAIGSQLAGLAAYVHHDALLEDGPPRWLGLALFLAAWQVMIAAMMLPSSLPLVRLFASAAEGQRRPGAAIAGLLGGYAFVWSAFGVLALGFDLAVHRGVDSSGWLHEHEWVIGASVLALAGAFQFTKLKDACLERCRRPSQFLLRHYGRGARRGFAVGARHGIFCVGCCWALMLVMFAAGVASLVWMALLTAVMVYEKTQPLGRRVVPLTGFALLGISSTVALYGAWAAGAI